jgi:hypothetical protein
LRICPLNKWGALYHKRTRGIEKLILQRNSRKPEQAANFERSICQEFELKKLIAKKPKKKLTDLAMTLFVFFS